MSMLMVFRIFFASTSESSTRETLKGGRLTGHRPRRKPLVGCRSGLTPWFDGENARESRAVLAGRAKDWLSAVWHEKWSITSLSVFSVGVRNDTTSY